MTTPLRDARSTVYFSRLRASSSFLASASAVADAVCAPLCAFSSSDTLTEPSVFNASSRCRSDSACRACVVAAIELLPRRVLGQPVVDVVEHCQHVTLAHFLADVDLALHDLAADAKCLVDFVARLHGADVAVRFLGLVVADLGGANGRGASAGGASDVHAQSSAAIGKWQERHGERAFSRRFLMSIDGVHEFGERVALAAAGASAGSNACQPPPSAL